MRLILALQMSWCTRRRSSKPSLTSLTRRLQKCQATKLARNTARPSPALDLPPLNFTFSLPLSTLDIGISILLLVNSKNTVDRVRRVSEGGLLTVMTSMTQGQTCYRTSTARTDLRTSTAAVTTYLGLLCGLVANNPRKSSNYYSSNL